MVMNMRNREDIDYTYKDRKVVMLLAIKYFGDNDSLLAQVELHDLDKMFMYLFYDKKVASKLHREQNAHHANEIEKTELDYMEMVLDWESARYTKPDKPLNAFDTLYAYYPEMEDVILPVLQYMGIAEANTPMEEDIFKAVQAMGEPTTSDIEKELTKGVKVYLKTKKTD